mmetsp:Transcript_6836/g.21432  ORF Transcript_6836/g.21432 Transcript_6836/m.21432 type:complete len:263 (-) Transcript_6836:1180-1968(-)
MSSGAAKPLCLSMHCLMTQRRRSTASCAATCLATLRSSASRRFSLRSSSRRWRRSRSSALRCTSRSFASFSRSCCLSMRWSHSFARIETRVRSFSMRSASVRGATGFDLDDAEAAAKQLCTAADRRCENSDSTPTARLPSDAVESKRTLAVASSMATLVVLLASAATSTMMGSTLVAKSSAGKKATSVMKCLMLTCEKQLETTLSSERMAMSLICASSDSRPSRAASLSSSGAACWHTDTLCGLLRHAKSSRASASADSSRL